jgi:hypothetical protein
VPRFLGFEARLVPSHVGVYRCPGRGCLVDLSHGDGGGLGLRTGPDLLVPRARATSAPVWVGVATTGEGASGGG